MQYMQKATAILNEKKVLGEVVIEMVVWQLPRTTADRPHGYKYRLYCGRAGKCLVRYDNETGKSDHIHYGHAERPYRFVTLEKLIADFEADVAQLIEGD